VAPRRAADRPPEGSERTPAAKPPAAKRATRAPARKRTPKPPPPSDVQAVVFTLGDDEYALPIEQVREVIAYRDPRRVAGGATWVRGVINLRGTIVPVCDLAARLGRDGERAASAKIVIVEVPAGAAGLIVDSVREVLTVEAAQLDRLTFTDDAAVTGIAKLGERLVVLLDAPSALEGAGL
jgi:purine-binding chemotaxis protein CheW